MKLIIKEADVKKEAITNAVLNHPIIKNYKVEAMAALTGQLGYFNTTTSPQEINAINFVLGWLGKGNLKNK